MSRQSRTPGSGSMHTKSGHLPTPDCLALRTHETVRPAKPLQVVKAGGVIREPCPHICVVGWIVMPSSRREASVCVVTPILCAYRTQMDTPLYPNFYRRLPWGDLELSSQEPWSPSSRFLVNVKDERHSITLRYRRNCNSHYKLFARFLF